jgi:hypothetical protein
MKFNEWLRIDELTSMSQVDSSGVELLKSGNNYVYFFADPSDVEGRGGRPFEVIMQDVGPRLVGKTLYKKIWEIIFKKNGSTRLTGDSGSGGTAVYGKLMAAIKKLTEIEDVGGLLFAGAHPNMDIMYDRFAKAFGFVPVGQSVFVKKEILDREKSSDIDGSTSDDVDLNLIVHNKRIKEIKRMKIAFRNALSNKNAIIGKVVGYNPDGKSNIVHPAIVVDIDDEKFTLIVYFSPTEIMKLNLSMVNDLYDPSGTYKDLIVSPRKIDASVMRDMMDTIKKSTSRRLYGRPNLPGTIQSISPENSSTSINDIMLPARFDGSTYDLGLEKAPTFVDLH